MNRTELLHLISEHARHNGTGSLNRAHSVLTELLTAIVDKLYPDVQFEVPELADLVVGGETIYTGTIPLEAKILPAPEDEDEDEVVEGVATEEPTEAPAEDVVEADETEDAKAKKPAARSKPKA